MGRPRWPGPSRRGRDTRRRGGCPRTLLSDRRSRGRTLAIDRKVESVAPVGPAAVIDRDIVMTEKRQDEGELRRADPRLVVADQALATRDVGSQEHFAERITASEDAGRGLGRGRNGDVARPGNVTKPAGVSLESAVFSRWTRVEKENIRRSEHGPHVGRDEAHPWLGSWNVAGRGRCMTRVRHVPARGNPGVESSVQDPTGFEAI